MRTNNKRGQAAMEFLMTYGWAILAAIIAIGVLAYFGVFNPGRFVGGAAVVSAPFGISASNVESTGTGNNDGSVNLDIIQNSGDTMENVVVTITGTGTSDSITCVSSSITSWSPGARQSLDIDCAETVGSNNINDKMASGESFIGDIRITYEKTQSDIQQQTNGAIRDTIQ